MSNHDPINETRASASQGRQRIRGYITAVIAVAALTGVFASSSLGQQLGRRAVMSPLGMEVAAAFGDGFGLGLTGGDGQNGLLNGAIEAIVQARADRMIRHLSIEIDATTEQQDKLRAIAHDAVKDLLPVRETVLAARASARELLTQQTIDRAAIEKLRADQIAIYDAASKRLVQAVADAAEALTPEQRRKFSTMLPPRQRPWGEGLWGHGPWGHWGGFGRN